MSQLGNVWDNAAMASFFSSPNVERLGRKTYHMCNHVSLSNDRLGVSFAESVFYPFERKRTVEIWFAFDKAANKAQLGRG